ncbi:MAG: twin-arginine translocase subunit TatC [Candidatus Zixiibacteriota bacterium]
MTNGEVNHETPELGSMPFLDHLEELRRRLLKSIVAVVVMALVAFYFSEELMSFLVTPLGDIKLHVTEVTGSFYAYLKVSLVAGVVAASPIVFYQLWAFIAPGLYQHEKARVLPLVLVSTILFLIGASFCYLVVLPFSLKFLIGFSGDLLSPIITVGSYLTFAGILMLAFGVGFEMPVVAYFLGRVGLISSRFLAKGRRYAIVLILIIAAVLTPTPDVATQLMLAGPLYLLYEVSIILVKVTGRKRQQEE